MTLAHYSKSPVSFAKSIVQDAGYMDGLKPRGLWVSDDDAEMNWQEWCVVEQFNTDRLAYRTEVILRPEANVLFIRTEADLRAFHKKYAKPLYPGCPERSEVIDWARLGKEYDGIIITPYQWSCRFDFAIWYYAWDCASGCIWNADAVELKRSEPFDIDDYAKRKASGREEAA